MNLYVDDRTIPLSNLDKVLWPEDGITKADLINYFLQVAPFMLPHLEGRPLVITRYPDGIYGKSFYQKNRPPHTPEWVRTFLQRSRDGKAIEYLMAEGPATLVWLANLAAIEIHPWLSRVDALERPDLLIFDLDPAEPAGYQECLPVARLLRQVLEELGLESYPKTSGATGLHVYVPVVPEHSYEEVRGFVEAVGYLLREALPDLVTLERKVSARRGKVYIDYLQNVRGKTLVAPYCPRPRAGAPVSTPLMWEEVFASGPHDFTLRTVPARLKLRGDPFADAVGRSQVLPEKVGRLL